MEIKYIILYFAGWLGIFIAIFTIYENIKLRKEIKILRKKLGKE